MARARQLGWTVAVLVVAAPFLVTLSVILWNTAFPLREAIGLFEDTANRPALQFFSAETSYYRPLFHVTISALWHQAGSLEATLAGIKLLHIVPVVLLVVLFIWHLRPTTALDAAVAIVALTVLVGSLGFRDNLEIPLSYTIVGMPAALLAWMLLNRAPRPWLAPAIVALALLAVGFKEQGLVVLPLIVAAWWMRAPGATRGLAAAAVAIGGIYVVWRLAAEASWPMFQQSVGFGFSELEPPEAEARFGDFPYWIYAYSGMATIANVLFSEPTRGVFRFVHDIVRGQPDIWEILQLCSSAAVTILIGWLGVRAWRQDRWSPESRLFVVMLVVLLASGVLSFNYSRDRLGGMAVVFYALAAFFALRAAAARALAAPQRLFIAGTVALVLLAAVWQTRAVATLEIARAFSSTNRLQWLVLLPERREEYRERQVYLDIMDAMLAHGTDPRAARQTRYPAWVKRTLGLP